MAEEGNNFKLIVGIAVLMVVIAAGTSYMFMNYFAKSGNKTETVAKKENIGPTYSLGDFVVNLSGSGGYQYIKANIVVEVSKNNLVEELEKRSPQIRDRIISILRGQKLEDIQKPGTEVLKNNIKVSLNQILAGGKITNVWFTQLVVQ